MVRVRSYKKRNNIFVESHNRRNPRRKVTFSEVAIGLQNTYEVYNKIDNINEFSNSSEEERYQIALKKLIELGFPPIRAIIIATEISKGLFFNR